MDPILSHGQVGLRKTSTLLLPSGEREQNILPQNMSLSWLFLRTYKHRRSFEYQVEVTPFKGIFTFIRNISVLYQEEGDD